MVTLGFSVGGILGDDLIKTKKKKWIVLNDLQIINVGDVDLCTTQV